MMQASLRRRDHRPAWTLSFADLMMLLLTFFILLTSISEVDSKRYRQLAASLDNTQQSSRDAANDDSMMTAPPMVIPSTAPMVQREKHDGVTDFTKALRGEIDSGLIQLEQNEGSVVIRFQERIAFNSASETLGENFTPVLEKVSRMLAETPGTIMVSGHTDDQPISTYRFRSNWELSTARAVSVIHELLKRSDIPADRLTAVGYADTRPLVPNDSEEHRALNRRVEIRIDLPEKPAANAASSHPDSLRKPTAADVRENRNAVTSSRDQLQPRTFR